MRIRDEDHEQDAPVEALSFDSADRAMAGLTVGAAKHESRMRKRA